MEEFVDILTKFAVSYGLKIVGAILILIIGRIVAGILRRLIVRAMTRSKVDPTVTTFVGNLVFILTISISILAGLAKFGVQTASFVAVMGAIGFAIGFALQGSLANFAAGILILILRPYKVGDYIVAGGAEGKVMGIRTFTTELATLDNKKILVPNGKLLSDNIENLTGYEKRRVDLVIGISYGSSISQAIKIARDVMAEDPRVLSDPEPAVFVSELGDSSVNLHVWPWVKPGDYWAVYFDITKRVKEAFDAGGVEIPFPQRVVHMASKAEPVSG